MVNQVLQLKIFVLIVWRYLKDVLKNVNCKITTYC
jgi:hypothetical protein